MQTNTFPDSVPSWISRLRTLNQDSVTHACHVVVAMKCSSLVGIISQSLPGYELDVALKQMQSDPIWAGQNRVVLFQSFFDSHFLK